MTKRQREKERQSKTVVYRKTEVDRGRHTDREGDRKTKRGKERQRERQKDGKTDIVAERQKDRESTLNTDNTIGANTMKENEIKKEKRKERQREIERERNRKSQQTHLIQNFKQCLIDICVKYHKLYLSSYVSYRISKTSFF